MNIMVITSSPNKEGLTEACGNSAEQGALESGARVTRIRLNDLNISHCHACNGGYGTCRSNNTCQVEDDFQSIQKSMSEMDAFVMITPVYWWDMSESAKAFFDRLRRCEAFNKSKNDFEDKPVICVAAAGGTGNGTLSCLSSMEKLFTHMKAERFDFISITRKTRGHKLDTIRSSVMEMVSYLKLNK